MFFVCLFVFLAFFFFFFFFFFSSAFFVRPDVIFKKEKKKEGINLMIYLFYDPLFLLNTAFYGLLCIMMFCHCSALYNTFSLVY